MNKMSYSELLKKIAKLETENANLRTENSQEAEQANLIKFIDDVIIVFDSNANYLQMSPPKKEQEYKPLTQIIGSNVTEVLPKKEAALFQTAIAKCLKEKQTVNISYSIKLGEEIIWYDGHLTPLSNKNILFVGRNITQYKQKELALLNSELKHKAIFDNTSHAFILINKSHKIESSNNKLNVISKRIFGDNFDEYTFLNTAQVENSKISKRIKIAFENKKNSTEVKIIRGTTKYYFEFRFSPVKTKKGDIVAVFISILEITKRKLAEKRLFKNKANLKAMFDSSQSLYHLIDVNYKIISFNKLVKNYYLESYQLELEEGLDILRYMPSDKLQVFEKNVQKALKGKKVIIEDWFHIEANSSYWAEFQFLPVYDEKNEIIGVAYIILDINEKYKFIEDIKFQNEELIALNEELKVSNEELKENQLVIQNTKDAFFTIFSQSPDAIIITNKLGTILDCNEETLSLVSEEKENIIGKSAFTYIKTNEKRKIVKALKNINLGEVVKDIEVLIFTNKEKKLYVEFSLSSFKGGNLGEIQYIIILKNVTQRKKAIFALEKSERDLKETNISKDKFFSIIAHDLKNPFNNIMGFSELLLEDINSYSTEKIREIIAWINESSTQGYSLLENLLNWSRSQTGRLEWTPEAVDVIKMINIEADLLKKTAIKKGVRLKFPTKGRKLIFADKNMITTVIRNLISNAIKFTKADGVIEVIAESSKEGDFIKISVVDTGIGISPLAMKTIFRIDTNSTTLGTDEETGTGLGLILCEEFVEKNGGKIIVKSKVGEGSSFSFSLPSADSKK